MKFIHSLMKKVEPAFRKEGKLSAFHPVYEMIETILFVLPTRTSKGAHIRDAFDMKRMMITVVFAITPAFLFGIYNVGDRFYAAKGASALFHEKILQGLFVVIPIYIVVLAVGGIWEVVFAIVRKHEISEGFLVTSILIPLIVPPTIPLWQVAIATTFGVVLGKEVFGGVGMNIFNPALVARAFLFFAYPREMSGDLVWVVSAGGAADGITAATPLGIASAELTQPIVDALSAKGFTLWNMFAGFIPGSIGETSTIAILLGGLFLVITGVASARVMLSVFAGGMAMALLCNAFAPAPSHLMALPPHYHVVIGGFAFGAVFMATDPVSASSTNTGKVVYGAFIGMLAVLIRVFNPAYPEGMMLAILFMNAFAPLIDHVVVGMNKQRRLRRASQ